MLWRAEQPVTLRPKTFEVLVYLVTHAGQLVTKEALFDVIWPETAVPYPTRIKDLAGRHRIFAGRLADRQSQTVPSEDPGYGDLGPAFPAWPSPRREPILQPPRPEIPPSPRILERALDRDTEWEAAD
jgi:hypothetical protein